MWPMFALNYNLPPCLATKKFFLMFFLLIAGKELVKNNNIYMALLGEGVVRALDSIFNNSYTHKFKYYKITLMHPSLPIKGFPMMLNA
jgi:hypothetical protein